MDKAAEQLIKAFTHLAREIQIYCLSGSLLIAEVFIIDHFYHNQTVWEYWRTIRYNYLIMVFISYIFGNLSYALIYYLLEDRWLEKKLKNFKHKKDTSIPEQEDLLRKDK